MSNLKNRLARLEEQTGGKERTIVLRLVRAGQELALPPESCDEILADAGFSPKGGIFVLDFLHVPDGLNATQLEGYLREHVDEICGWRRHQA